MGQLLLDGVPIGIPSQTVSTVTVNWSKTVNASDGTSVDVTPAIPAGYSVIGASVIFTYSTHWVYANLHQSGSSYTLFLRNFFTGSSFPVTGKVIFTILK